MKIKNGEIVKYNSPIYGKKGQTYSKPTLCNNLIFNCEMYLTISIILKFEIKDLKIIAQIRAYQKSRM